MIPISECVHGGFYRLKARHLAFGVFLAGSSSFMGIREQYGSRRLDSEWHHAVGGGRGTAEPLEFLGMCPVVDRRESEEFPEPRPALMKWIEERSWLKVVFASDCDEDGNCPDCGIDFAECPCPGPSQEEEFEYREVDGILQARKLTA